MPTILHLLQSPFKKIEPGYYKEGHYGIRIETILRVVPTRFQVFIYLIFFLYLQ